MNRPRNNRLNARNGFTLIELAIVIGILGLLVAITIGVGSSMINSGKEQATKGILESLDQTLSAYIDAKGENPPALVAVYLDDLPGSIKSRVDLSNFAYYPAFDGTTDGGKVYVNSVGLYLYTAQEVSAVQEIVQGINPKFIKQFAPARAQSGGGGIGGGASIAEQPLLQTVFDAWGNPIRFVHPKFDGIIERTRRSLDDDGNQVRLDQPSNGFFVNPPTGSSFIIKQVRRNKMTKQELADDPRLVADSDGGLCPGARPYFYSAGPDGNPATTEDNVYTTIPTFVKPL
ncbi:MAG: type II secretion system protein [Phycisphaerales bacterium]|nr:type II secretion system protein [Phycisphaerales bacterium]